MPAVLSHPFRIGPTGAIAVVEEDTEAAHAEAVAVVCLTRKGERPMVPSFGVVDPVFDELDVAEVNAVLATHGPGITVTDVEVTYPDSTTAAVRLSFES